MNLRLHIKNQHKSVLIRMNLRLLIKSKKAKVAIIGMGYVGLPHAILVAKAGFSVFGHSSSGGQ